MRSVTLARDGGGRYFASLGADQVSEAVWPEPHTEVIGIGLGLRDLAVVSDGAHVHTLHTLHTPKALQLKLTRLRCYPRRQSRQVAAQMRAQGLDPNTPCPKGVRLGLRQLAASCSAPTGQGPGSDARAVACAAERTRRVTAECAQRRPTQNRELAPRPVKAKSAQGLSATAR